MTGAQPISTGRMQVPTDPAGAGVSDRQPGDVPAELARLVVDVREAALNPAVLENLAAAIVHAKHWNVGEPLAELLRVPAESSGEKAFRATSGGPSVVPAEMAVRLLGRDRADILSPSLQRRWDSLARLVAADTARSAEVTRMQALWRQHVSWHVPAPIRDSLESRGLLTPPAPQSLLEFAADYLRDHPGQDADVFFAPFNDIVQRGIDIPRLIAIAFTRQHLPFQTFCDLARACASELPPKAPSRFFSLARMQALSEGSDDAGVAAGWQRGFSAICSPIAISLMDGGRVTMDTLLDWTGMGTRPQRPADGGIAARNRAPDPFLAAERIAGFLATWTTDPDLDSAKATRNAAFIEDPEALRLLVDRRVPNSHIACLLSVADSVPWQILRGEINRVIERYDEILTGAAMFREAHAIHLRPPQAAGGPWDRHSFQAQLLLESQRNMVPHQLLNRDRSNGSLDRWAIIGHRIHGVPAGILFQHTPGRALIDAWSAEGVPAEEQVWMSRFLQQGFDEHWVRDIVEDHMGEPARIVSWFGYGLVEDLKIHLDAPMQTAARLWIDDFTIAPGMLAAAPAMIHCDMGVDGIDFLLRSAPPARLQAVFRPEAGTPWNVRYGLCSPGQLYDWIVDSRLSVDDLATIAARRSADISPLRREVADTRVRLRACLHAMTSVIAGIPLNGLNARRCEQLRSAWRDALDVLNGLLDSSLEHRQIQRPQEIADTLGALCAHLSLQLRDTVRDTE